MHEEILAIKAVLFHLSSAQKAYNAYRQNPVYLHASNIFKGNEAALEVIRVYAGFFSEERKNWVLDLVEHLDVWVEQFRQLEEDIEPRTDTEFVFERFPGSKPFPGESVENLKAWLKEQEA